MSAALDPLDARWITAPGDDPQNPLLRAVLHLPSPPLSARWRYTGLGTVRAWVNGSPASASRLDPGLTDPRARVQVLEVDIAPLLRAGENVLGLDLGRGFHALTTENVWRWEQAPWRGPVRAWAHLRVDLADGSSRILATGPEWRTAPGPVTHDSMYAGETFDPREDPAAWRLPGYDDTAWDPVLVEPDRPASRRRAVGDEPILQLQAQEPIVVREEIAPRTVSVGPERIVLDLGRVIAGWCRFELAAHVDALAEPVAFRARHGEKLRADGTVDDDSEHIRGDRFQRDDVRLRPGIAESFEPQHSYKGFRYVQLEAVAGDLADVRVAGLLAHADLAPASTLTCSEPLVARFDAAMRASLANNMHHVPTDTPMHEKNGWTGDALTALAAMTTSFDMHRMLRKWLDDQVDAQRADGSLSVISPNPGWGYEELSPAPEWTTLMPVLLDELACEYGDLEAVRTHEPAARRYLDHELSRRDGDGLISGVLGDYLTPGSPGPAPDDKRLSATLMVGSALRRLAHALELADLAGGAELRASAQELEEAVNRVFLDAERGLYRDPAGTGHGYRQTSNLLPLALGTVPAEHVAAVQENLVRAIEGAGDHHDCGHLGVRFLLPVLSAAGQGALAWRVLANPTAPGWRAWLEAGNSTFMEMWEDPRSCSHYFMGTPATWLHENVAGLRRGPDGWGNFLVAPDPDVPVGRITMTRRTRAGEISLAVDREARTLRLTVPDGTRARVLLPGTDRQLGPGEHALDW
ncbi:family 78 glycoside hydrolase catalytic domain [Brachybacterium sp. J144]|uniref:family 78 glycoside hydrolase catalytic domain n=1 Tax=Brachybacterium sp. J144 TaxID=3116487 RepID=UPI002E764E7B|nr:family 78 glycoside hydrolase catalytic domain [Brachybacterium sp. J144]MEE1651527.1 family 78 glycoside hydrolase catalytic domain [Brachybacterium sp. J144]